VAEDAPTVSSSASGAAPTSTGPPWRTPSSTALAQRCGPGTHARSSAVAAPPRSSSASRWRCVWSFRKEAAPGPATAWSAWWPRNGSARSSRSHARRRRLAHGPTRALM